jgi:IS5 family transposase
VSSFLEEMDAVVPWAELMALVEPHYPRAKPAASRWGLRSCFGSISCRSGSRCRDPGVEYALYESPVLRRFADIDLGRAPVPAQDDHS